MKKLKIMLVITVVIIIVLIVSILLVIRHGQIEELNRQDAAYRNGMNNPGLLIIGKKPELVTLNNMYFSIEACVQKMMTYAKDDNKDAAYDILEEQYIKDKRITKDNIFEATGLKNIGKYKVEEIYQLTGSNYTSNYLKAITKGNQNIYFNINWDTKNSAFDLKILTKNEYERYINTTIEKADPIENTIEKNSNNSIPYKYLTQDEEAEKYFLDYINNAFDFPEIAYIKLDEEYRKVKFGSLDNFKEYVKNNTKLNNMYNSWNLNPEDFPSYRDYLLSSKQLGLEEYSIEKKDGYTRYVCVDTYGNYYIFKATSPMQYTLIADTYTIDIPEFVTRYNESNPQEKMVLNLNKFMLALNDKDYKFIYNNMLADSFKKANFPTLEEFAAYARENFFEENSFEYEKFGNEAGTYYTYDVQITNAKRK